MIDLDKLFQSLKPEEVVVDTTIPQESFYMDPKYRRVLEEVCYKLPKGYPTIENGIFTVPAEVLIINEALEAEGLQHIPEMATKKYIRPSTGTNDISLKEGLVCLFYDVYSKPALAKILNTVYPQIMDKKQVADPKLINTLSTGISKVYNDNKKYYGAGKSMPQNLDKYVEYVLNTKDELSTVTNAVSAAAAIHKNINSAGRIIRNETFDAIRIKAVSLIKEQYNITLQADNWCPGDVYLVIDKASTQAALNAETVNIGKKAINSQFQKNKGLVAVSLKEEKAQAGKATTFADTIFTNTFKADLDPSAKYGTSDNKNLAKLSAKITRFEDYFYGPKSGGRRSQSYQEAISKNGVVHGSVNTILGAAGLPKIKSNEIKPAKTDDLFYKANKPIFDNVVSAIAKLKGQMGGANSKKKVQDNFIQSRSKFIKDLTKYKVAVDAVDSAKFSKDVQQQNEEPVSVLSKKIAAYELASTILNKWSDKNAKISPAYKKIQEMSNPFAALTAFAIAEAGISPSFWKVIGREKSMMGEGHFFDAKATVDIDTKTSKIRLIDSPKQAGFYLGYTTLLGGKKYSTKLVFRFSGSEIRIEVQELKAI